MGGTELPDFLNPFFYYVGTYDTDAVCDLQIVQDLDALIGVAALLAGDDSTGVGVIDDALIPIIGASAGACAVEDIVERRLGGYLNCDENGLRYEVYEPKTLVPVQPIILAKCN